VQPKGFFVPPQDQRFSRVETNILRLSKRREGTDDDPADFSGPPLMNNRLRAPLPSLALNPGSGTPVYRQLYAAYRDAILSGQLRGGTQLPSTRELALELGISRTTVMNGFDQLRAKGYIGGKAGSGTFVENGLARKQDPPVRKQSKPVHHTELSREALRTPSVPQLPASLPPIPFRTGLPAVDRFPHKEWSRLVARLSRNATSLNLKHGETQGDLNFRSTIAEYLRHFKGVRCDPEQIFILSGSQQALHLIVRLVLNEGDTACIEDPSYRSARRVLITLGARVMPVPVDDEGMQVERAFQPQKTPKLIYVTPSHQFPLGVTMSLSRRRNSPPNEDC
jgi:GntR family transcriptional regulator/MocR family aminotransferase